MTQCQTCQYDTPEVYCSQGVERTSRTEHVAWLFKPFHDAVSLTGFTNRPLTPCDKYLKEKRTPTSGESGQCSEGKGAS